MHEAFNVTQLQTQERTVVLENGESIKLTRLTFTVAPNRKSAPKLHTRVAETIRNWRHTHAHRPHLVAEVEKALQPVHSRSMS